MHNHAYDVQQGANETGKALSFDLQVLLDSWLEQRGFPLVTVQTQNNGCQVNASFVNVTIPNAALAILAFRLDGSLTLKKKRVVVSYARKFLVLHLMHFTSTYWLDRLDDSHACCQQIIIATRYSLNKLV